MKRFTAVLAGLILIAGLVAAQMDDVPPDHWAYQAVQEMVQKGIIKGYPDGKFRGNRPITRYEVAQMVAEAFRNIDQRLKELSDRLDKIAPPQAPVDVSQLQKDVAELKSAVQELRTLSDAVQKLDRLGQTFQQELASLGVDVEALKKDYAALADRVKALEEKRAFQLGGDLSFGVFATHGLDGKSAFHLNAGAAGAQGSILAGTEVLHELALGVSGNVNENVTGRALFTVGNYLPFLGTAAGFPSIRTVSNTDITIWEAFVQTPIDLFGTTLNLTIGRFPAKLTPYTLSRVNPDYYLSFPRYNDGAFRVDGAYGSFDFGTVKLGLWAARTNTVRTNNGISFSNFVLGAPTPVSGSRPSGLTSGALSSEQFAGARLDVDVLRGENTTATLGVTYFAVGGPAVPPPSGLFEGTYNRVDVLGAGFNVKFAERFTLGAEYAQTFLFSGKTKKHDKDSWAAAATLNYDVADNFKVGVGYREIRPFFGAPGYWGRIGFWYNPTDLKGFTVNASYKFSEDLAAQIGGEFYEGAEGGPGFQSSDKVNRILAGIQYKFSDRWDLSFDYEGVLWELGGGTWTGANAGKKPVENYFTLGIGYNLGENTSWKFMYQIIDYDAKGAPAWSAPTSGRNKAGVASTTLSIKF